LQKPKVVRLIILLASAHCKQVMPKGDNLFLWMGFCNHLCTMDGNATVVEKAYISDRIAPLTE